MIPCSPLSLVTMKNLYPLWRWRTWSTFGLVRSTWPTFECRLRRKCMAEHKVSKRRNRRRLVIYRNKRHLARRETTCLSWAEKAHGVNKGQFTGSVKAWCNTEWGPIRFCLQCWHFDNSTSSYYRVSSLGSWGPTQCYWDAQPLWARGGCESIL